MDIFSSSLTPQPPPENTDTATSHARISRIPTNGKPIPTRSSGTPQHFGETNLQIRETSADPSPVPSLPHQVSSSESDDGGWQAYVNSFGIIAGESIYQPNTSILDPTTVPGSTHEGGSVRDKEEYDDGEDDEQHYPQHELSTRSRGTADDYMAGSRNDSPGRQYLEEWLYKLRLKTGPGSAVDTHKTWGVPWEDGLDDHDEGEAQAAVTDSGIPEIPDTTVHQGSPSFPPIPQSDTGEMARMQDPHWPHQGYGSEIRRQTPPWQLIHQRLLSWTIIWPMPELDAAIGSTTRGHQVDEISLSIWATQSYKRYVRSRMTDSPQGRVDRLLVPPNVADAISTAVFNGRHGDACTMLRDLWAPFGLDGIPRLLLVLARHRADENHWVVHRCACGSYSSVGSWNPDF